MRFAHDPDTRERVERVDLGLAWDPGAPLPHLVQSEHRTFLAFYLRDSDPTWDGTSVTVVDLEKEVTEDIGVIEWLWCGGAVLGGLNDEARKGHPLWSKGLDQISYGAAEVVGSLWVQEMERANRVAFPESGSDTQSHHFLLAFHDSTFECVAGGFVSYRTRQSMRSVVQELADRVLDRKDLPFGAVARGQETNV